MSIVCSLCIFDSVQVLRVLAARVAVVLMLRLEVSLRCLLTKWSMLNQLTRYATTGPLPFKVPGTECITSYHSSCFPKDLHLC